MNSPSNSSNTPKKRSFASDVLTLVGGTTFAQIIGILAAPILTRVYGPEEFGIYALFLSITGIFGVIVCLSYEYSIMLPKSDEEAANLLGLSLLIALIVSIFTIPVVWIGRVPIQNLLKAPLLSTYLCFTPLFVFVSGVFLALNYWNSRKKKFKRLSTAKITNSVSSIGTQLGAGFSGYATGGSLIGAHLLGQTVSTLILGGQIWISDKILFLNNIRLKKMISGLKRYRKFPLIDCWSNLLNTVSWQLPAFLLSYFFSQSIVGFYSIGFRLLQLPMSFIGASISQVFFQRVSDVKHNGTLASLVENVFRLLVIIGLFPILIITIVGGDVFTVVFGKAWTEAGVYAQILSLWAFVWFISSPLSTIYVVMEKQEFGFKFNIANFITRLLSLLTGGFLGDARLALFLFSVSGILVYGYLCFKMLDYSGVELSHSKKIIFSSFKLFIPAGLIILVLKLIGINHILITVISTLFCVAYYLYIIKTDPQIQSLTIIRSIKTKL